MQKYINKETGDIVEAFQWTDGEEREYLYKSENILYPEEPFNPCIFCKSPLYTNHGFFQIDLSRNSLVQCCMNDWIIDYEDKNDELKRKALSNEEFLEQYEEYTE